MLEDKLKGILLKNPNTLTDLRTIHSLQLKNAYIAAGYVRNQVWDKLHGYLERTPFNDVDVIYFDDKNVNEETEKHFEARLRQYNRNVKWSVKNQARMHLRNHEKPYKGIEDAIKRWPETATAVGIRLNDMGGLDVLAPHGLEDLFALRVRRSPYFQDPDFYLQRVMEKGWLKRWDKLTLES